jgi:hypothetical protein
LVVADAEESPERDSDCDLDGRGIAAKAAVANRRSITLRIFGLEDSWTDRPPCITVRQANNNRESETRLDDFIVSPLSGNAHLRYGLEVSMIRVTVRPIKIFAEYEPKEWSYLTGTAGLLFFIS